jgi:hypothetical protein
VGYYGIDWLGRAIIAWAIWNLHKNPPKAYRGFIVANVFSIALAFMAHPTIWGSVVGDSVFMLMYFRNLRKARAVTNVITNKGENKTWSAP